MPELSKNKLPDDHSASGGMGLRPIPAVELSPFFLGRQLGVPVEVFGGH